MRDYLPSCLEGNGSLINYFVLRPLPLDFEVIIGNGGGFYELHVIDIDFFSDDIGLF
jgi:hypothetical protein